jgi:hypothetical protein
MQLTRVVVSLLLATSAQSIRFGNHAGANETICQSENLKLRQQLQVKLATFGPECEEMCKKMGLPNESCNCPGMGGTAATEGDDRGCYEKYCQDPSTPCPTDNFVGCVKEITKVSALQWPALFQQWDAALKHGKTNKNPAALVELGSCTAMDSEHRAQVHARLVAMGVPCEEMCGKMSLKPENCGCQGFGGTTASEGDERACFTKYCQDPSTPCPTDNFVGCVKEMTTVSAFLQWDALFQRFDDYINHWKKVLH